MKNNLLLLVRSYPPYLEDLSFNRKLRSRHAVMKAGSLNKALNVAYYRRLDPRESEDVHSVGELTTCLAQRQQGRILTCNFRALTVERQ
jgi:hypothetical protein